MSSKGVKNNSIDKSVQNSEKTNPIQKGKQSFHLDMSSLSKNNYINQQGNQINNSMDMGASSNQVAIKNKAKLNQSSLNTSNIEGYGQNNHNDSSFIMGRKIENQNNIVINGTNSTQNQNTNKFPIPIDSMKTKKQNISINYGRVSKQSQDDSQFLETADKDIIQTDLIYMSQQNQNQDLKEIQRQLYYQSMCNDGVSKSDYIDGNDILQTNNTLQHQQVYKTLNIDQQQNYLNQIQEAQKQMKAVSSGGSMNNQNRPNSPKSNQIKFLNQQLENPSDNAQSGKIKKIKRVEGVLKVVKKSQTPKKKSKNKDISSKEVTKKSNKKEKQKQNNFLLFENKAIQDVSYVVQNKEENFNNQFEMNNYILNEINSNKEISEKCENNVNTEIAFQNNIQRDIPVDRELWNQQHQEYVQKLQNITNQEDFMNLKNSGRQTTFSFRNKGRNSQTPSSRQKKKKKSSSRNQEQNNVIKLNKPRSKSRSKSRQRALSSLEMNKQGNINSASKFQNQHYQEDQKKNLIGGNIQNLKGKNENNSNGKSSPQSKSFTIYNEDKSKEIQQMILKNIKMKQKEELIKKKHEEEEIYQKNMKKKEINQKNTEIRQINAQKANLVKRNSDQNFPWGMDQQKHKQNKERSRERSIKEFSPPSKSRTEKDRRDEMGLQFLNDISQDEIDKLIQNNKIWYNSIVQQNKENKKEFTKEEKQKIQFFMQLQKKQLKRNQSDQLKEQIRKQNVKKNLENLNQLVREQRSKSSQRSHNRSHSQIVNQSIPNIKKDYSLNIDNNIIKPENEQYQEDFQDQNFDFTQNQYKKFDQKEQDTQSINDKSMSFNLTNNSNNRSFQTNYDIKKNSSNQNSHNESNQNKINFNNNSSKQNVNNIQNQHKTQAKTSNNSKRHSRNNSNLNSSVIGVGTHQRSKSRGAATSNNNEPQGDNSFINNNSIDFLQEKKRQLKQQYSLISDRMKKQRDEKNLQKQQQTHSQSFSQGEDIQNINNMSKFTDHNLSIISSNQLNKDFISQQKYSISTSNKNLSENADKQTTDNHSQYQIKQKNNDSNQAPQFQKSKDLKPQQQRHSDFIAAPSGSSRQSNYHTANTPTSSGFSRPQSKLSDKKSKKKSSNSTNTSLNNISINKSGKKKQIKNKTSKTDSINQNYLQRESSPQKINAFNPTDLNNNINFDIIEQLKQILSPQQILSLTPDQLYELQNSYLEQQQNIQQIQQQQFHKHQESIQQDSEMNEQVNEEENTEYDYDDLQFYKYNAKQYQDENGQYEVQEEYDQNEYNQNDEYLQNNDGQQFNSNPMNQFPPQKNDNLIGQNNVQQLYENYDQELDIDSFEINNQQYLNQNLNQQQIIKNQNYINPNNSFIYPHQQNPMQLQGQNGNYYFYEQQEACDDQEGNYDDGDEDEQNRMDEQGVYDDDDEEIEDGCNAHIHHKENQEEGEPSKRLNNNVDEPFEIEELDTSNFTEQGYYEGGLHSTINNEENKSQSSSSRSEQEKNIERENQKNNEKNQIELKPEEIRIGLKKVKKDLNKQKIDTESREEELNISEMRRIEKEYQEQIQKQQNQEKVTFLKSRTNQNESVVNNKQDNIKDIQSFNKNKISQQATASAKKEAARVIVKCIKELKTRRVVRNAFQRYFYGPEEMIYHENGNNIHDNEEEIFDHLNEGMQIFTERNDSAVDTMINPNDVLINSINLQTSKKNLKQSKENIKTPKSQNNQPQKNSEIYKNLKELTSQTNENNKTQNNNQGTKMQFDKDFQSKNKDILQDLCVEEIPFSKYGFVKQNQENSEKSLTQTDKNVRQQVQNHNSQKNTQDKEKINEAINSRYNYMEDDDCEKYLEIEDEDKFDQILSDLHKQVLKNQQSTKQDKSQFDINQNQQQTSTKANKIQNSQISQYSSNHPYNKPDTSSKFNQIEKIIDTNPTDQEEIHQNEDEDDDENMKSQDDDEDDEYENLNKNYEQNYSQTDESSEFNFNEQAIQNKQQQNNSQKNRNQDQNILQDSDMDEDQYNQYGQESYDEGNLSEKDSQSNQQNNKNDNSGKDANNTFDDYLDQSLNEKNKNEDSSSNNSQLSKPNSEDLIELLAKQQFKKTSSAEQKGQIIKAVPDRNKDEGINQQNKNNFKKKPQLKISCKNNEQNFEIDENSLQELEEINKKNNSQPKKNDKAEDNLISELGINDEWSNQKKKGNEKKFYETDMQVLGGSSNEIFDNQINQSGGGVRHNFLMTSGALDTQKLNNLIAGGHQRYQMSSEDKKYQIQEYYDEQQGGVDELVGINSTHQNNTLQFKEINENQRSLVTVKEFNKSDWLDNTKNTIFNSANNKKKNERSSTEFSKDKQIEDGNKIEAIPEINNTFISESSDHQSSYSSLHSQRQSKNFKKSGVNENQSSQESSQKKSHNSSISTTSKVHTKQQYEYEISKIKEEEALKWNQMINILNSLQNQGSIPKEAAEQMKIFSEMNKKQLELLNPSKNNSEIKNQENTDENSFNSQPPIKKIPNLKQQNNNNSISQADDVEERLVKMEINKSQKQQGGKSYDNQNNLKQKKESPFKFDLPQPYEKSIDGIQSDINKEEVQRMKKQQGDKGQKQQRKKDLQIDVDKITETYYRNQSNTLQDEEGINEENSKDFKQDSSNSNQLTTNSNINNLSGNNNINSEDKIRFEEDFQNSNSSNATNIQKNIISGNSQFNKIKQQSINQNAVRPKDKENLIVKSNLRKETNFYDEDQEYNRFKSNSVEDDQSLSSITSPNNQKISQKHRPDINSTDGKDSVFGSSASKNRSIFEINTFGEQFTDHKMKEILQMDKIDDIFDVAQQALNVRKEAKSIHLQNMFDKQHISPKSFERKQQQLEKWVFKEQQSIERTKIRMQKTIMNAEETIKKTQRDIEFSIQMKNKKAVLSSSSYNNLLQNQDFDILQVSLSEEDDHLSSASSSHRYYLHHHHHPQPIFEPNEIKQDQDKQQQNKKQQQHQILIASCTPDSSTSNNIKVIDDFDFCSAYDQNSQIATQFEQNITNSRNDNQKQIMHSGPPQSLANSSNTSGNNLSDNINKNSSNNNNSSSSQSSLRRLSKDKSLQQLQNLEDVSNQNSQKSLNNYQANSIRTSQDSQDIRQLTETERKNLQFEKKREVTGSSGTSNRNLNNSQHYFQEDEFDTLHSSAQQSSQNSLPIPSDRNANVKSFDHSIANSNIQINNKYTQNQPNTATKINIFKQDNPDIKYIDETSKNFLDSVNRNSDLIQQRKFNLPFSDPHQNSQESSMETVEEHELPQQNKQAMTYMNKQSNQQSVQNNNMSIIENKNIQQNQKDKNLNKQNQEHDINLSSEDLNQSIEWEDELPQPKRGGVIPQRNNQQQEQLDENLDDQEYLLEDQNNPGNFYQKSVKQSVLQNPSGISVSSVSNNNSAVSVEHQNYNVNQNSANIQSNNNNSNSQNFLKYSNSKSDKSDLLYSNSKETDNISDIYLTAEKDAHYQKIQKIKDASDEITLLNNHISQDLNVLEMELLDESASQYPTYNSQNINGGDFIIPDTQKGLNGGFIKLSNLINQYNPSEQVSKIPLQKVSPTQSQQGSNENLPVIQQQNQSSLFKIEDQMHRNEPKIAINDTKSHYINKFEIDQQDNTSQSNEQIVNSKEQQKKESETICSTILNDILKEVFEDNQRPFKSQGFKTNLNCVKEYILNVSSHIQNDNDYKTKFLTHINTWLGPQPEELLKLLHMYDPSQDEQLDTSDESSYSTQPILDGKLYADIERKRNIQPSQDNKENLIKTLERIHNKAIFEAFNEALDYQRMYGLRGKPFPWKITHEKISEKPHSSQDIPRILQKAAEKVVEWSSSLCGIIVDKEDSHFQPGINLDEDYLQQIKEDRLNRMLSSEVVENEEKWILYDEEQTEVQVELSQMVFDLLIYEACNEFRKISINQTQLFNNMNNSNQESK